MPLWVIILVLGIIEGITEFIPISSTGHLIITEKLFAETGALGPDHWLVKAGPLKDLFNVVIQSGAVLAVLPLFPERLRQFFFEWRKPETQMYLLKIAVAFGITGVGGLILEKNHFTLPEHLLPVTIALAAGGVLFLLVERGLRGRKLLEEISWPIVIAVGVGQLIAAVFPGTSRSGATILLALCFGLSRPLATEFTFLVGIPTMLSAGGLKIFKALQQTSGAPAEYWPMVMLGFVAAAIVSFIAVKWLLRYVQTHTFVLFGWYRIVLAAVLLMVLLLA
ncbi:MAG TPA: undecaprenyl-diphosphate phosphatase [Clostridia bacterium]|nr:undecaprenyl-diphosphate phosphatase [Clostridia bacterium]